MAKTKAIAQFGDEVLKRMRTMAAGPAFVADVNWKKADSGSTPVYDLPAQKP